jgi:hypothetical protein
MRSRPKGVLPKGKSLHASTENAAGSGLFAFCRQGAVWRSKWANVVAAPTKAMALCQPRRRELSAGIATNRQADRFTRMAHDTGAWKSNVDAQRAVAPSSTGVAEGTIGSLGAEL